jgi:hypothetical protein
MLQKFFIQMHCIVKSEFPELGKISIEKIVSQNNEAA